MAQRRMFSKKITHTDAFLDMSQGAKVLYFYLALEADDDGFVDSPKRIIKMIGANEDDYKLLIVKKFIILFESGICVVKHWLIHNYIQSDRYSPTQWIDEKKRLKIDEKTKKYSLLKDGEENVYILDTQDRLGKDSIVKNKDNKQKNKTFFIPSLEEIKKYCEERNNNINAEQFFDFYESKGWFVGRNKMKDWKAAIRTWEKRNGDNSDKNKKPFFRGEEMRMSKGKWYVIPKDGSSWLEFAGNKEEIEWK